MYKLKAAEWRPQHFGWQVKARVATITLNRPERKNPLTFESYAELRDTFHKLQYAEDVRAVVFTGEGGNFCSGGDVHEIIGPLVKMDMPDLMRFTRMTGNFVKEMRNCPQPIIAAVDGVCAGAGAIISMASDLRYATPAARTAFLFVKVGLSGADMGACALLPRIIGQGRAAELLYTGRVMDGTEAERWGFFNKLSEPENVLADAQALTKTLSDGTTYRSQPPAPSSRTQWRACWSTRLSWCVPARALIQAATSGPSDRCAASKNGQRKCA